MKNNSHSRSSRGHETLIDQNLLTSIATAATRSRLLPFLMVLLCACASTSAQNFALRWHAPGNVEGDPTNCIAMVWDIGTNTVAPLGFFITNAAGRDWYLKFSETNYFASRSNALAQAEQTRTANLGALRSLFEDFADFERGWQNGTNYNAAAMQTILRKHNAVILRLRPVLQDLYKGD
jgi:hypothetical protein